MKKKHLLYAFLTSCSTHLMQTRLLYWQLTLVSLQVLKADFISQSVPFHHFHISPLHGGIQRVRMYVCLRAAGPIHCRTLLAPTQNSVVRHLKRHHTSLYGLPLRHLGLRLLRHVPKVLRRSGAEQISVHFFFFLEPPWPRLSGSRDSIFFFGDDLNLILPTGKNQCKTRFYVQTYTYIYTHARARSRLLF